MRTIDILAEQLSPLERFEALKRWTGAGDESGGIGGGGILLGIAALLFGIVLLIGFIFVASALTSPNKKRVVRNPRRLFRDAVQQLGLATSDRQLLSRLAADVQIDNPVVLMISPRAFDQAAEHWVGHFRPGEADRQRSSLAGLRKRVFADAAWRDAFLPVNVGAPSAPPLPVDDAQ